MRNEVIWQKFSGKLPEISRNSKWIQLPIFLQNSFFLEITRFKFKNMWKAAKVLLHQETPYFTSDDKGKKNWERFFLLQKLSDHKIPVTT